PCYLHNRSLPLQYIVPLPTRRSSDLPWDSERASSGVLKEAMEQKGFKVEVTPVDVAVVFETVANGDADATIAAWLPITHQEFFEDRKSTRLNSSHVSISYAVFCVKKK